MLLQTYMKTLGYLYRGTFLARNFFWTKVEYGFGSRQSVYVYNFQSWHAAQLLIRFRRKIRYIIMKLSYFLDVLLFFQNMKFCSLKIHLFLDVRLCHVLRDSGLLPSKKYEYQLFIA